MELDDPLYQCYLEELHSLEGFQAIYDQENPRSILEREDPDFKRLIEVLALFSARTHMTALRNVGAVRRRLYQQFFPYLLAPLPAMAMTKATPTGHMPETLNLPARTELALFLGRGRTVLFQTLRPLKIMPIKLQAIKQELLAEAGSRLLLTFTTSYPLNEHIETLSLHINYLNDFLLSLKAFHFLEINLQRVGVQFGEYSNENFGENCGYRLGAPAPDSADPDECPHPLLAERLYFHYPQQELYLDLELPESPPNWSRFTLMLDCKEAWPRQLQINKELFQLFVTPVANNVRAFSMPVICDGLEERYPIRHPQLEFGFTLQEVLGVYQIKEEGMMPLRPGILAGGNASYEIEQGSSGSKGGHLYWLVPHFPGAFESPVTLVVEARWLQAWYEPALHRSNTMQPYYRQTDGLKWSFLDTPVAYAVNRQFDITQDSGYLHLLTLMHKSSLNKQDLLDLLATLGSVSHSRFQSLLSGLTDLRLEEQPQTVAERKIIKLLYHLRFKNTLEENEFLIAAFVRHVEYVLNAWISDSLVEVQAEDFDEAIHL